MNDFMIKISHLLKVVDVYQQATGLADSSIVNAYVLVGTLPLVGLMMR